MMGLILTMVCTVHGITLGVIQGSISSFAKRLPFNLTC